MELQFLDNNNLESQEDYNFTRVGSIDACFEPTVTCTYNVQLKTGDIFYYGPWSENQIVTIFEDGEVGMAASDRTIGGARSWYTQNGDGVKLLRGEKITAVWDGSASVEIQFLDNNNMWRQGGYNFARVEELEDSCFYPAAEPCS